MIHKTAIIDSMAKISSSVTIGPYTVIGADVEIDNNTIIQSHVNINGYTTIGKIIRFILLLQLAATRKT